MNAPDNTLRQRIYDEADERNQEILNKAREPVAQLFAAHNGRMRPDVYFREAKKLGLDEKLARQAVINAGARHLLVIEGASQPSAPSASSTLDDDDSIMPGSRPLVVSAEAEAAAQAVIQHLSRRRAQADSQVSAPVDDDPEAAESARQIAQFLPRRRSDPKK